MSMRKMKDSGIPWIGMMPEEWKLSRGKFLLRYLQKPIREDDDVITCFRDGEVTLRRNRRELGFTMSDKEIGYQGIDVGDLVVHGMDGFAGSIGISDSRGKASPVLNVLDTSQNKKYIMYYLRNMAYCNVFLALATGIRVRSCDLRWNKLAELVYPIPPLIEQERIVHYIDKKIAETNLLITDYYKQIDVLEQYRNSVITESVTHGLNIKKEKKDSGIAWIGSIPDDWTLIKGKYLFAQKSERGNNICLQLLTPSQKYGVIPQSLYEELTGMTAVKLKEDVNLASLKTIHKGGFCISLRSFQGGFEYSEYEGVVSPAYQIFYPLIKIEARYFKYLFKERGFIEKMNSYTMSLRDGKNIAFEDFANTIIPVPPISEQENISNFLDKKCGIIDALIADIQKQIDYLSNYQKSIIFEFVTGKKEVPA